jgi:DNA-binding MarR family transcriptional regulator
MNKANDNLNFVLELSKINAALTRRFDAGLGGLGFNEFAILYHLNQTQDGHMRRIDLAEKIGLTASGVTRLLLPMEKIGLVKKETDKYDARVSLVILAPSGKRRLTESFERAEYLAEESVPADVQKKLNGLTALLSDMSRTVK